MNGYEQPTGNPHRKTHSKRRPKVPKIPEKERELRTAKDAHSPLGTNQRPSDARLLADLERAHDDLGRLIGALPGVLARLRDAEQGQPAAQSYGEGGARVVLWCSRHESDRCTEPDSAGELIPCSTLIAHPMRPDSVGEAAVNPDQARADETTLVRAIVGDPTLQNGGLVAQVERAMVVVAAWSPRAADVAALRRKAEDDNRTWCENCATIDNPITGQPRKEWPRGQGKTTVGGRLPFPMYLCDWCCKIVVRTAEVLGTGRVPTEAELHRHHDEGKPVHIAVDPQAISASRTSTAAP